MCCYSRMTAFDRRNMKEGKPHVHASYVQVVSVVVVVVVVVFVVVSVFCCCLKIRSLVCID